MLKKIDFFLRTVRNTLPIRWRVPEISLVDRARLRILVSRQMMPRPNRVLTACLELRAVGRGETRIVREPLELIGDGTFCATVPVAALLVDSALIITFDLYLVLDGQCTRLAASQSGHPKSLPVDGFEILPWTREDQSCSLIISRARSQPKAGFDVAVVLNQINYTGGKTKAMITLAGQLKSQGLKVKIVAMNLSKEPPNFPLPNDVPIEFATSVT
ncbi:glycosyltransferase family 4 protein [Maritimibacter fusiformis]|uniref:Glycosyltransferase family 4 protein n=1 Tax=Maritimibacter fusiformis TaxID=2603819 RepID=A0A5D0RLW5_9RHOB|nr:glycosyltransferase family 4 protein [Maritimibacter fusiformis]TYB82443.1 glycosyltransferase family 4 protein [Maritimibacter fusiformis]